MKKTSILINISNKIFVFLYPDISDIISIVLKSLKKYTYMRRIKIFNLIFYSFFIDNGGKYGKKRYYINE